jgi:archaemetzincin
MKIGILRFGQVMPEVLSGVAQGLVRTFPDTSCEIVGKVLPVPQQAFDTKRNQYRSGMLLELTRAFAAGQAQFDCVLGVVNADIFVAGLNYVFGEAYTPGHAAVISLWRLRPEFYGEQPNPALYVLRALKEAVHEVGHTLGLQHCTRSLCVMHFSNSIFDTDKKQSFFCDQCYLHASIAINNVG